MNVGMADAAVKQIDGHIRLADITALDFS